MHTGHRALFAVAIGFALTVAGVVARPAYAQSSAQTQRELDKVNRELEQVAAERRSIEGRRGEASRALRRVDEQVGDSARALRETEAQLAQQQAALAELHAQRDTMQAALATQRSTLAQLLRAAYTIGDHAALKLMLSQDRVADANRALVYHGYLQRERMRRIGALGEELAQLRRVEGEIVARQAVLDAARARQREQLAALERDRRERAATVAQLDQRFEDSSARADALGRDAEALETLLAQLRAAAARAEAQRRAAAAAAARERAKAQVADGKAAPPPVVVAKNAPIRVGGLGWPLSGALLAGYGGTLPDGRESSGVLIGAPAGTPVQAVADGTVVFSQWMTGYGLILIIDHGNGAMSLYAHNDALFKDAGAQVERGDAIASVGNSGGHGQPALYFELRRDGKPVDPATWLQKR